MNVLFLDQYSDPGGAQRCLLEVVQAAKARSWAVRVALPGEGQIIRELDRLGASVSPIACGPFASGRKAASDFARFLAQLPAQVKQVRQLVESFHPDVLYVNGPRLMPAACAAAASVPVLFHCHSLLASEHAWIVNRSLDLVARSGVIAGSRYVAAPFSHRGPRMVYNGVPDYWTGRPLRQYRRIGVIGRIAPEKGQLEFVRAVRMLRSKDDLRFVICGEPLFADQTASRYWQLVKEESEGLPVEFLGWRMDVRDVLAELDLLIVPSPGAECTPLVILEAYSAGVPVIAFASGGIPEVIEHGVTGILVNSPTPEALAEALSGVLSDTSGFLRLMVARARQLWRRRFSEAVFTRQILESIVDLAAPVHAIEAPSPASGT